LWALAFNSQSIKYLPEAVVGVAGLSSDW